MALAGVALRDVDGEEVVLGDVVDRPTVVVVPRYYGCLPCRDYLRRLSERLDEVHALGAAALGVSAGAGHQARWLMEKQGVRFPLLLDPERRLHAALDLPRRWWVSLNPRGWRAYAGAMRRGNRQGRIVEPNQIPGLAVLDRDVMAVWIHRGRALGDYPPIDRVLRELERLREPDAA